MFKFCNHTIVRVEHDSVIDTDPYHRTTVTYITEKGDKLAVTQYHYDQTIDALTDELVAASYKAYVDYLRS